MPEANHESPVSSVTAIYSLSKYCMRNQCRFLDHTYMYQTCVQSNTNPCPLSVFAHVATTFGCINFKSYCPNAKSALLYILTPSPTLRHDLGATSTEIIKVKGKQHAKFQLPSIKCTQVMTSKTNADLMSI